MKKILALFIVVFMIASTVFINTNILAYDSVLLYLDGNPINSDVPACIINNRAMVPARSILEAVGAVVSWDGASRTMAASKGDVIVWIGEGIGAMSVKRGDYTYVVDFDVLPCILYDRTYIPVKPVLAEFGYFTNWNPSARSVNISTYTANTTNVASAANGAETINISGFTPPVRITVGNSYSITGTVTTNAVLNRLNVKVTDTATGQVQINETHFDIGAASYSLADIDNRVRFGVLSAGNKLLEITAVTNNETRQKFTYYFEVGRPVAAQVSGGATMLWPVPSSGLITTIFWCDNQYCHSNAGRVNGHAAIDIAANENAAVIAVKDGTVIKTGFGTNENGFNGFGNFILIDHGNGLTTQYSHLYSIYVSEGDVVSAGQTIGGVGNTGNSTGNHLDFHIEQDGKRCDPLYYLEMHPNVVCYEPCDKIYFDEALRSRGLK